MKTTIEIPDPLYKRAKIRAVEEGTSLKALVLGALERELGISASKGEKAKRPYFARRKLLPEYEAFLKAGAFTGGTDSTRILSRERDAR